ncbi:MAG: hypothetical protein SA339_13660 [Methanomassiliicoccus sp.]|nr:hypothetical protein [Methanomassiliicoccus sp.]
MDVGFDEALRVARQCIADRTGDREAMVTRYERGKDHYFQFATRKGDRGVVVGRNGITRHCFREDRDETLAPREMSQNEAVERALGFIGEGEVETIKARGGGYEVDVDRGAEGRFRLFVDREGTVHCQKCSELSRNLAADID